MSRTRSEIGRRTILEGALGLGLVMCLPCALEASQGDADVNLPKDGDFLVKTGDAGKRPLTPDDIAADAGPVMALAMDADKVIRSGSRLNAILLVRLDPASLAVDTLSRAAAGVVAYSAVCTHQGCEVSDWIGDSKTLSCPCHDSEFDPKDGGKVVDGPAPRMLPALPLKLIEGKLAVAGAFTSRPGFS
jgi:rieske iron-sulfur protein